MTNYVVILAIYIITFLIGLPANLLPLYTFLVKVCKKPAPADILLLSLTLSNILLLIFLPLKMAEAAQDGEWPFPEDLCSITSCIFHSCIYISTLLLTAISVDRYLGVVFPIRYRLKRKLAYAVVASLFIWLLVGSHCSAVFYVRSLHDKSPTNHNVCYKEFNEQQKRIIYPFRLELCLVLFCIPFIITFFCYLNVIRILSSLPSIQAHKKQRSVGLALVTLLNFVICFGPFNVCHIFSMIHSADPKWRDYSFALSSFNTCLDPFIFFFSSSSIRKNVGIFWAGVCRRIRPTIPCCPWPCWKDPRDTDEGAGDVRLSTLRQSRRIGLAAEPCSVPVLQ